MSIILRAELKELIDTKGKYILIDVREKEELVYGMIPTAHHVALHELEKAFSLSEEDFQKEYHFSKPQKGEKIICYCRTGGRSARATQFIASLGYTQVLNYAGSVYDWADIDSSVKKY